jgi:hypothetical protein
MPCDPVVSKSTNYNTNYYRRNKIERFNVKQCPHCDYNTTGPKSSLNAHIWSKHTAEHDRPFQCPECNCKRGFASRAHLYKHIQKEHEVNMPKRSKNILVLKISLPDNYEENNFYKENSIIQVKDLPIVCNNIKYTYDKIIYDSLKGNINNQELNRNDLLEILRKN